MFVLTPEARRKSRLVSRVLVIVTIVIGLKLAAHGLGWEVISLNPLFSGILAANVFLMGFLLSGVLSDYKESERLPGELACSIKIMADEAWSLGRARQVPVGRECFDHLLDLSLSVKEWFHKRQRTTDLMAMLDRLNDFFVAFEPHLQANFIVRLKQEQGTARRILTRIHTIRDTHFITSGYLVAEITTLLLVAGLILSRIDPHYESLFFVGVITFLLAFLNLLIRDLDNPFGYYEDGSTEDVSLEPMNNLIENLVTMSPSPLAGVPKIRGTHTPAGANTPPQGGLSWN